MFSCNFLILVEVTFVALLLFNPILQVCVLSIMCTFKCHYYLKISNFFAPLPTDMRDKMRKWREENYRNSEQIVDVGEELINEYASKLGDDSE